MSFCLQYPCRDGDCTADCILHFSSFTLDTFAILAFSSLCLLCGCFWLAGQVSCDWGSILVSRAFSGGFDHVLGALGFLLPPCTFCGLPILLCGKAKG